MTSIDLCIGSQDIRVSANRRVTSLLQEALPDRVVVDKEAPIGFQVRTDGRLRRRHTVVDRCGFVLGSARHAGTAASILLSHLTALTEPAPTRVRIRARALLHRGEAILCLYPLLFVPPLDEGALIAEQCSLLDALAFDVDASTGRLVRPTVAWKASSKGSVPLGHMSMFDLPEGGLPVRRIVAPSSVGTRAQMAVRIIEERLGATGSAGKAAALAAARAIVDGAEIVGVSLWDQHLVRELVADQRFD